MPESTSVDLRDRRTAAKLSQDPDEIYAEEFAACLLMPKELVCREWKRLDRYSRQSGRGIGPVLMAYTFGVTVEDMQDRLCSLGLWDYADKGLPRASCG
jgi:Zn-dependent peptidase ImmA (M78 family)